MNVTVETAQVGKYKVLVATGYHPKIVEALRKGSYEGRERGVIPSLLKPGDKVLEVGGAIGAVTMAAADVVGPQNVISFEANSALIEDAKRNFELNALEIRMENAVLNNRVRWAGPGSTVDFHVHKEYWESSLLKTPGTIRTIQVPTKCFETEARNFGSNVLICDIEGGEIDLLELADLSGFSKILMEIHYWAAGREAINRLVRKLVFDGFSVDFEHSFRSIVIFHRGSSSA